MLLPIFRQIDLLNGNRIDNWRQFLFAIFIRHNLAVLFNVYALDVWYEMHIGNKINSFIPQNFLSIKVYFHIEVIIWKRYVFKFPSWVGSKL